MNKSIFSAEMKTRHKLSYQVQELENKLSMIPHKVH